MTKYIKTLIAATVITTAGISCQENEFGTVDLTPVVDEAEYPDYIGDGLNHPCMLLTNDDFTFIKSQLADPNSIQSRAYAWMTRPSNSHTQPGYTPNAVKYLARLDATNWGAWNDRWEKTGFDKNDFYEGIVSSYMNYSRDCAAAFAQAILWKISGKAEYAQTAVNILNSWASNCKGFVTDKNGDFVDPNENLIALTTYQMVNAAELMRDYEGWSKSDFGKFRTWTLNVLYPQNKKFIRHANEACPTHAWFNWDLAQLTAILSIGILNDDNDIINEAIGYYKYDGDGSGYYENAIPFVHKDPDSPEMLAQCQEMGRDQGHSTLCVGMLANMCRMAMNIGDDMLAYADYRALGMFEHFAKYNVGTTEVVGNNGKGWAMTGFRYTASQVPFTTLTKCTNSGQKSWSEISYEEKQSGNDTRGTLNPSWELVCRLAQDAGQSALYSTMIRDLMRTNPNRGNVDGGAGDYGPDSGGYDIFGWGSLIYARD